MKKGYIFVFVFALFLIGAFNPVEAKDFVIYNTTNPSQNYFSVNGSSGITSGNFFGSWNGSSLYVPYTGTTSNLNLGNYNITNISNIQSYYINNTDGAYFGGNIGIGTTSPGAKLVVKQSSDSTAQGFWIQNGAGDGTGIIWMNDSDMILQKGGNTNQLVLDNSGNVGIGTTSPATLVDLKAANDVEVLSWRNAGYLLGTLGRSSGTYNSGGLSLWRDGSTKTIYLNAGDGGISYFNAGNVGIGTTSPGAKLEVKGSVNVYDDGNSPLYRVGDDTSNYANMQWVSTNYLTFGTREAGTFYGNGLVLKSGNVGIGTTAPAQLLHTHKTSGNNHNYITTDDALGDTGLWFSHDYSGTANWAGMVFDQSDDALKIFNAQTAQNHLVINNTGNVGIGTTSPRGILDVNGIYSYFGTSAGGSRLQDSGASGAGIWMRFTDDKMYIDSATETLFRQNGAEKVRITNAGNVGIGTTAPGYPLEISAANTRNVAMLGIIGSGATGGNENVDLGLLINIDARDDVSNQNLLNVQEASVSKFIIKSSGNVGIGTTSPARKLHINNTMRIEPTTTAPSSASLGDLYVDSDTNELCFYNSTSWVGLSGGGVCA